MKKQLLPFAITILILLSCSPKEESLPTTDSQTSITVSHDLSNMRVTAFAEDQFGHIWIGTTHGLNKYNGEEYQQYYAGRELSSLPDNHITNLFLDSRKRLWVVTLNNSLCYYSDQDNFRRIPVGHYSMSHSSLLETEDGQILLNDERSIYAYQEDSAKMVRVIPIEAHRNAGCFPNGKGQLILVVADKLLFYRTSDFQFVNAIQLDDEIRYAILEDNTRLWLSSKGKLSIYDINSSSMISVPNILSEFFDKRKLTLTSLCQHGKDKLFINTNEAGLFVFDTKAETIVPADQATLPLKIGKYEVHALFADSNNNLWIGTDGDGIRVISSRKEAFSTLPISTYFNNMSITGLNYDPKGRLWISAFKDDLYCYDTLTCEIKYVKDLSSLGEGNCRNIFTDHEGNLWLTMANCILKYHYNGQSLTFARRYDLSRPNYVCEDSNHTIWTSAMGCQLLYLPEGSSEFQALNEFENSEKFIPRLLPLRNGHVLVTGIDHGIFDIGIAGNKMLKAIATIDQIKATLSVDQFVPEVMLEDNNGHIWIGTSSHGVLLIDFQNHTLKNVQDISSQEISSMELDNQGNIWIGTQYGLNKFDSDGRHLATYLREDGTSSNAFADNVSCKLPDGTLIFGTTQGITALNAIHKTVETSVPLVFGNIKVNNIFVLPGKGRCIEKMLALKPNIKLRHNQNHFTISYGVPDYGLKGNVRYFYMLDGRDDQWTDAEANNKAYFTNISPGDYTLRVKVTDKYGQQTYSENSIPISIARAPWATWWAFLVYALSLGILAYYISRNRLRAIAEKRRIRKLLKEKQQEQRTNEINKSYFANVAHQLRTPLTMISGPVETLCSSKDIPPHDKKLLGIVGHNVGRMLRLVNQLMDFNKLETDALSLKVKLVDINSIVRHAIEIYQINADEKGIRMVLNSEEDNFYMYADTDKVENILENLLSNAIKYTPRCGNIIITLRKIPTALICQHLRPAGKADAAEYAEISVTDSGEPIPEDQLEKIFLRYYQLGNKVKGKYNWGTGIGLYYARKLAELHHGYLIAQNDQNTNQTVFSFALPTGKDDYSDYEKDQHIDQEQAKARPDLYEPVQKAYDDDDFDNPTKPLILIVDDDTDITYYLRTLLSPHYRVQCRYDAESAGKSLDVEMPDLVLSDVMMEGMTGFEFCRSLKDNALYCHIPVILLTAKDSLHDQITGLDSGADAYITKPFHAEYLLSMIRTILKNRNRVKSVLSDVTRTETLGAKDLSPQDKAFMDELFSLMEKELDNQEFNITQCVERMHVSHTKFINKVKALTGTTPAEYFKNYKLNRAAALLKEGKYNISEVTYMTGFSSLAHFSKVFKRKFGMNPSQFMNPRRENDS